MRLIHFILLALFPVVLVVAGTTGYHLIEGWSLFDALYMTVITLVTIGYQEVHPLSHSGRVFTIFLSMGGVFTILYAVTTLIRVVVGGELGKMLGRQRMERSLTALSQHTIVCGFGRMGRRVCQELSSLGVAYVVIDKSQESLDEHAAELKGAILLQGDATNDEVLKRAGVERAKAVIAALAHDADNLYVTMSSRLLNDKLFIVARSEDDQADAKLKRAGANRVVCPYAAGGYRMAQAIVRPTVVDFIDLATSTAHLELQMEETRIGPGSALAGTSLREFRLREDLGIIVVAIKRGEEMTYNPPPDRPLATGDILVALGHPEKLAKLDEIASPGARRP